MNEQLRIARETAREILLKNGIKRAAFFGSIVRGEMTDESDIDILVEFEGRKSLLDLAGLKLDLEDALERRLDLLTYRSLHPMLKDRILAKPSPYTMKKDAKVFIHHILESISLIEVYSNGKIYTYQPRLFCLEWHFWKSRAYPCNFSQMEKRW